MKVQSISKKKPEIQVRTQGQIKDKKINAMVLVPAFLKLLKTIINIK